MRQYHGVDRLMDQIDLAFKTWATAVGVQPDCPGSQNLQGALTDQERNHTARLMRINRVGEVSAQALYHAQAVFGHRSAVAHFMEQAAAEEASHLAWCQQRLDELGGRASYLEPAWYAGSWLLGAMAGCCGDGYSLGFVVETERQVESHLDEHLAQLSSADHRTRSLLEAMRDDEGDHADRAADLGALPLPAWVKRSMRLSSMIMKKIAYWV